MAMSKEELICRGSRHLLEKTKRVMTEIGPLNVEDLQGVEADMSLLSVVRRIFFLIGNKVLLIKGLNYVHEGKHKFNQRITKNYELR